MITEKSKLKELIKTPQMRGREYMVRVSEGIPAAIFANMSFQGIQKMCGWDAVSIAEGMRYLNQEMKKRNLFYDFWTEEEKEKDPTKKNTGLAAFTTDKKSKYIVLCAGGAYQVVCSLIEAYPLAERLNKMGYSVFVLSYRAGKHGNMPNPIEDLAQAIKFIHAHAEEFQVETEDYAVMGASAGGHLAASIGTESIGYKCYGIPKPGCIFLAYPVISYVEEAEHKTIKGMRQVSLGKKNMNNRTFQEKYSIEKQVTDNYPPTFLWQCKEDAICPFINSQAMERSLKKYKIPYIYETYEGTVHGWGVADRTPAEGWLERAVKFWEDNMK